MGPMGPVGAMGPMGWMECNAVECNGMDRWNAMQWSGMQWIAFWSFWVILTLLVILGSNLAVFIQKRKKVNSSTRRRQIHLTT